MYHDNNFKPYRVVVLGGSGTIGYLVCEKLLLCKDIDLAIGYRKTSDCLKYFSENKVKNKFTYSFTNINLINEITLNNDIVVNCTGIADNNLIEKCNINNTHYIDPSSSEEIENIIKSNLTNRTSNLLIYSSGCNPGLTEMILKYINEKYQPDKISIYFSGNGLMSNSSIKELLKSSKKTNSYSLSYINYKKIENLSKFEINKEFSEPVGKVLCVPTISNSIFDVVKNMTIKQCFFYNTFKDEKMLVTLLSALEDIRTNKCELNNIEKIKNAYEIRFKSEKEKYTIYHCEIEKKNKTKSVIFHYSCDWNELTAIIILNVIKLIKKGMYKKSCKGVIWELFNLNEFIFESSSNLDFDSEL